MQFKLRAIFLFVFVLLLSRSQIRAEEFDNANSAEAESEESVENEESIAATTVQVPTKQKSLGSCGQPIPQIANDEMQEYATRFGEFPWTIALLEETEIAEKTKFLCGGVLITTNAILTTANCVDNFKQKPESLVVQAGQWNTLTPIEQTPIEQRRVSRIEMLDHFEKDYHMNNIALVLLETGLDFKDHIQPICLPEITELFDHRECVITFWDVNEAEFALKKTNATVMPVARCDEHLREFDITHDLPLHETVICATGVETGNACENLRGSLLICPVVGVEGRFSLGGIATGGQNCAESKFLGLFVNAALFRRWIDYNIRATSIKELHYALR